MKIDNNTIRYYLHTYDCLKEDIKLERELIDDFRAMQIDSIAQSSIAMRVQGGKPKNMLEEIAAERVDILRTHESRLAELLVVYGGIETYLHSVAKDSLNKWILEYRYFDKSKGGYTWEQVKRKLEKHDYYYETQSLRFRDIQIISDIIKRCVFKAQKREL